MYRRKTKEKGNKLLFITEFFPTSTKIDIHGGVEMRTYLVARELAKSNHVTVITSKNNNQNDQSTLEGVNVLYVGRAREYINRGDHLNRIIFIVSSLTTSLKLKFDIVEGAGLIAYLPALIAGIIKRRPRFAFVPDLFSSLNSFGGTNHVILSLFEKVILKSKWSGYIAISKFVKEKMIKFNVQSSKIKVIYCPFNYKKINKKLSPYPSVIYIGRLISYKRVSDLILALNIVRKKIPTVKLFIIGIGPDLNYLKKLVQSNSLSEAVNFLGFIKDHSSVMKYLSSSWIFSNPSSYEGFGIATIEAMSVHTPYIIPKSPLNLEITKRRGGFFYSLGNINNLAYKIIQILNEGKNGNKEITRKNDAITKDYMPDKIAEITYKFYTSVK